MIIYSLTLYSALGSALVAGILFIFSNTIMTSLAQLPAAQGITAMQHINKIILNPLFFMVFMGTAGTSLLLAVSWLWQEGSSLILLLGCVCYLVGVLFVTMRFNVPMNNALKAVAPQTAQAAALWAIYLKKWVFWNHIRVIASLLSAVFFILALE